MTTAGSTAPTAGAVRSVTEISALPAQQRFPALVTWAKEHARRPPSGTEEPQVGHLGRDVPLEIIDAAGVRPVQVVGDPTSEAALGDRYVGVGTEPRSRSQFTRLVDGTYTGLRALVCSHDSTTTLRVFYALRAYQMARGTPTFALQMVEVLHLPVRTSAVYSRDSVAAFREVAGQWGGRAVTDDALTDAVARRNRIRGLLADLAALRRADPPRLSGTHFLAAVAAGWALTATEYESVLVALRDAAPALDPLDGQRVFVTGSEIDDLGLYELLEASGLVVVGEDHDGGDLAWQGPVADTTGDPVGAVVDRIRRRPSAGPRAAAADRVSHLRSELAATAAVGVVGFVRAGDDGPAWDLARYRHLLAPHGVPILALTGRRYRDDDPSQEVVAFADRLRAGRAEEAADG